MSGYHKITLIIIKDIAQLELKDEQFNERIKAFEASLGSSLKPLGKINDVTKQITGSSCDTSVWPAFCQSLSSSVSEYLPSCLPCVEECPKEYEVLGIACSLEELEKAAEACGLLVPIAKVKGLFPKAWNIHPVLHYFFTHFNLGTVKEDDAKHYFKKEIRDKFTINDHYTEIPFTSAQCQILTAAHLNNMYYKFRKRYSKEDKIDPHLTESTVYKEGYMLHDLKEADKLADKWKCWGSPPLKQVRAYLGEKVGFTLAWKDCWVRWGLLLPSIFGVISVLYGCVLIGIGEDTPYIRRKRGENFTTNGTQLLLDINIGSLSKNIGVILDNPMVPYYALFICIWHVFCYIKWQRMTKLLQFQWGVGGYTLQDELERPGYHETPLEEVFQEEELGESQNVRCYRTLKKMVSLGAIIFLLGLVVGAFMLSLYVKFKLREVLEPDRTSSSGPIVFWIFDAQLISQIASGSTSAVCIFILRKVFNHASYKLTIFENHMFESDFERSLIWKLFAMDFINTHFYNILVMFFRSVFETNGIFNIDKENCDLCMHDDCISTVSVNVFTMLFLGFVMDQFTICSIGCKTIVSYLITNIFCPSTPTPTNNIEMTARNYQSNEDEESQPLSGDDELLAQVKKEFHYINETLPGDTNSSYDRDYSTLMYMLRKMQMYSVVVMYAAACPVAPVIVLLIEILNNVRDRSRYTGNQFRRPVAQRADGIGHWLSIQSLVNLIALTSNAFIIALRSTHGKQLFGVNWSNYYDIMKSTKCDPCDELAIVKDKGLWVLCLWLIVVMAVVTQALTNYFDYIPVYIKVAMRKQKFEVKKKLDNR